MAAEALQKIYDIREIGGEHVIDTLSEINKQFVAIRKAKQDLNRENMKASFDGDSEAVGKLSAQFEQLRLKEVQLRIERQELINQGKQAQLIRQQEIAQQKQIASGNEAVAGSYNDIAKQYRLLLQQTKNNQSLADGLKIDEAQAKLKDLKVQLDNFNRGLSPDGTLIGEYKTGILNAFKSSGLTDLIDSQLIQSKARVAELNSQFEVLKQELVNVRTTGQGSLDTLEKQLIENRSAAAELTGQIAAVEVELKGTGGIGTQITDTLNQNFKNLGSQITQTLVAYLSFQAAFEGIRSGIANAKELSDQTTNLEIELNKTAGGADRLVDSLAQLDTRTKLTQLEDIANIAAKAGVSEDNLVGVTEALDKIKVAFGKDFGDVEKGTEDLVKLINVFEGADAVNGDNLLRTGNAVRTLANESVASAPFLNDFATRMAGLKGISDITLPSVLGLASGFEQFGQSAEISSTALVRIIPKLATNTQKYGDIAGLTKKQFSDLLNSHPEEALIKVSEGLIKGKGSIEEISTAFEQSGLGKGRITTVLGVLGKNADTFRKSIDSANQSFQNTSNIEDAFAAKNENLASTLDKVSKSFADAANNKVFLATLTAISSVILFLIGNLPTLITIVALWAAGWAVANKELVLQYTQLGLVNAQLLISRIALGALTIAQTAYNVVIGLFTEEIALSTGALRLWGLTITSLPFGVILVALGAIIAGFISLSHVLSGSTDMLSEHYHQLQLNAEIQSKVSEATAGTTAKVAALTSVIKDNTVSLGARKQALQQLIAISPEYLGKLTLENIRTAEGVRIINDYVNALKKKAQAQAIDAGLTKSQESLIEAQRNEIRAASDASFAKQEYAKQTNTPFASSVLDAVKFGTANSEQAFMKQYYQEQQKEAQKDIDFYTQKVKEQVVDSAKQITDASKKGVIQTVGEREAELKEEIQGLVDSYELLAKTDEAGQEKNIKQRQALQKELDDLNAKKNGKPTKERAYGGAKLSGETKDDVKDAESETALLITELEKRKTLSSISETEYYTELNRITQDGIAKKLSVIKGSNAEEKKQRADLQLSSIKSTQEMNEKLYDLGEKSAKQTLESAKNDADNRLKLVTGNVNATELEKVQAQLKYDQQALNDQIKFNDTMDALESNYGAKSVENARKRADELSDEQRKILNDQIAIAKAAAADREKAINDAVSVATDNADAEFSKKQQTIFDTTYSTKKLQDKALQDLERQHQAEMLGIQLAGLIAMQNSIVQQGLSGTITWEDYQKKLADINRQIAKNQADTAKSGVDSAQAAKQATIDTINSIAQALQKVVTVFSAYADLQNEKIQNEQDAKEAQLDADKEKELSTANTEAEKAAIEDKYDKLKSENNKKYAEERRKIALSELAIQSALAAITAYTDGLKAGGPYGPIVGAAYVALVGVQYLLNRQKIMAQKFANGGELGKSLNVSRTIYNGGVFDGPSHSNGGIPFSFGGRNVEVQGKEGYVINAESMSSNKAMTVSGTPAQISSAANVAGGGVDFAPGARIMRFEYGGNLGAIVQPPVFRSYYGINSNSDNSELNKMYELMYGQVAALSAVNERIDNLKVTLVPKEVTDSQNKNKKSIRVGTL